MHNKKETLNIDTRLQSILKNGYPEIQNICKKLEENDNNMIILSSTERHKLWYYIKNLLKDDQKTAKLKAKRNGTTARTKQYNIRSDIYSLIVKVAVQTLKVDYIPDELPDVVILLNSGLPEINDTTVKDEVSSFLEECWKLKLTKQVKIVTNVLKHLIECAKVSLEHVIRLNDMKHAIPLLKSFEDMQNVMKLAREKTLLENSEGRDLLVYLFTIGEHWIMGIYNNIRVSLETVDSSCVKVYANIVIKAWQSTTDKKTIENCLENLIFHCLRVKRDINGRNKLGENLLTFLESFHIQTNNDVKHMICDQYFQFIWSCLEAPGCCVRCNAADVLFLAYPMNISGRILKTNSKLKKKTYLNKQHNAITNLLKDSNEKVCVIALKGMFHILKKFWTDIPSELVDVWLSLALENTKISNFPEIRKIIFLGLKSLLINRQSNTKLKEILPKFADSIYDTNVDVKLTVLELFLQIESSTNIQIWDVVPLNCIIECLDVTSDAEVVFLLHKLMWSRLSFSKDEESTVQEIIDASQININVVRKFFLHSKDIISYENALKLVNVIFSTIIHEIELLPEKEVNAEVRIKRHKPCINTEKESSEMSNHLSRNSDVNELSVIQVLVDVSALLYAVNREDLFRDTFKDDVKELNIKIAEKLRHIVEKFQDTQISETALFFLSLLPQQTVENHEEFSEKCKRKLLDQNVSDDTILSILHLLIKWNKVDVILNLLPNLLNDDGNLQKKLESFVQFETTDDEQETGRQTRMLKLGLRILQFIIQNEFQSRLVQEYHENMVEFWENLHFIKSLIANRFTDNNENSSIFPDDVLKIMFKHYISLIPLLHHSDDFRSGSHFSRIVTWVQEKIVLRASDLRDLETDEFSINILKCVLDTSNDMIAQFKAPPKLCCELIILYSKCLIARCGIAFVNHALVTILALIKFSTVMYNHDESELLKAVIPSLFAAVMVTLAKCPVDLVKKYTNNLKSLSDLIKNLFPILNQPLNRDVLRLGYMAIVFNAVVFCVSKDFEKLLASEQFTSMDILHQEFPFIAEEIIKIILHGEGFQDLCIDVLNKAISKYSSIDQLSSLLIIQRLVKSRNKTSLKKRKRIQNIVSSVKEKNQQSTGENSLISVRDRLVSDAKERVIQELLNS